MRPELLDRIPTGLEFVQLYYDPTTRRTYAVFKGPEPGALPGLPDKIWMYPVEPLGLEEGRG